MPAFVVGTADYDTLKSVDGILELVTDRDVGAYGERRAAFCVGRSVRRCPRRPTALDVGVGVARVAVVVASVALLPNFLLGGGGEGAEGGGGGGGLVSGRFGDGRGVCVIGGGAVRLAPPLPRCPWGSDWRWDRVGRYLVLGRQCGGRKWSLP